MSTAPILFITGTDTGVGKTFVTALLAAALRNAGKTVCPVKPVESGCRRGPDGSLIGADIELLSAAAGARAKNFYLYETPVAPQVAAEREGPPIDIDRITGGIKSAAAEADVVLVEGAGGLLVPFARGVSFADLAERCGASMLVVIGSRLGAINHSALTFEVLQRRGLPVAGYVLNDLFGGPSESSDVARETNREMIRQSAERYSGKYSGQYEISELGVIPYFDFRGELSELLRFSESAPIRQLCSAVIDSL